MLHAVFSSSPLRLLSGIFLISLLVLSCEMPSSGPNKEDADPVCGPEGEVYLNQTRAQQAGLNPGELAECALCKFPLQEYQARGLQKIQLFGEYLGLISQKRRSDLTEDSLKVATAVDEAVALFVNDQATVAVSGARTQHFTIRDYLSRVKNYAYGEVEILWTEIGYVTDMRRGQDGNYYWTVTITQAFRGYDLEGQPVYRDITTKTVEMVLKVFTISKNGQITFDCEVFLSDIGVKDTHV